MTRFEKINSERLERSMDAAWPRGKLRVPFREVSNRYDPEEVEPAVKAMQGNILTVGFCLKNSRKNLPSTSVQSVHLTLVDAPEPLKSRVS